MYPAYQRNTPMQYAIAEFDMMVGYRALVINLRNTFASCQ